MTQQLTKSAPPIKECLQSDVWKQQIESVLPKEMLIDAVLRVSRSAITINEKLAKCSPQSFLVALLKCARAGLYPDGREAHLIPYGTEVQAIFDWKGIVALVRRSGVDVTPKLVHENDEFEVDEDDGTGATKLFHKVNYKKPRGEIVAVWSRAAYSNGRVDYEVMTLDEVEEVRQKFSRAKDSDAWKKSFGEMAKKTVIRRHSKRWDMSPELRDAIFADDDTPSFPALPVTQPKLNQQPTVEVETEPVEDSTSILKVISDLRAKIKASKLEEEVVVEFIRDICPMPDDVVSLEAAAANSESTVRAVNNQWEEISRKIKEQ